MTTIALDAPFSPPVTDAGSPLTPGQFAQIGEAEVRSKRIRRVILVAAIDAWTSSIFAGMTVLGAIFSPSSLIVGVGFSAIAYNSFRGLRMLKRMDVRAPGVLAINQLWLAGLVTVYALYSMWDAAHGASLLNDPMFKDPALRDMLGNIQPMMTQITMAIYASLIVGTVVTQGLTAWYYASRKKFLETYLAETPGWILELQKKQADPS